MGNQSRRLMGRFFLLYLSVTLFGFAIITLSNVYINGLTLAELWQYNFKAMFVQVVFSVFIFQVLTHFRLRTVRQFFAAPQEKMVMAVWQRLIRFPSEVFWTMIVLGIFLSAAYHIGDAIISGEPLGVYFSESIQAISFEQTLVIILAITLFTLIRRLLKPYILRLPSERIRDFPRVTFLLPLLISFSSLMLVTVLSPWQYAVAMASLGTQINLQVMLFIAGTAFAFGLTLFLLFAWQLRDELRTLIRGILSLLEGETVWLHRRIPIMSQDEVGQLGVAFNQLQEHSSRAYQEVQREMQLAYHVQEKLLPESFHRIGDYQIAAVCRPIKEVGGDLHDIINLSEDRFAVISGDVSGHGMPAALVMSAMLVLLRSEVKRGGSAGEVLTRLNQSVVETLQGDMFVTLGLAVFSRKDQTCEYASAGHVAPYILREGQVRQIPCSSLPLGIDKAETYSHIAIPVKAADHFVFYTDGIVESMNAEGKMLGFQGFEAYLARLDTNASVEDQINSLVTKMPEGWGPHIDDITLIVVKCPS